MTITTTKSCITMTSRYKVSNNRADMEDVEVMAKTRTSKSAERTRLMWVRLDHDIRSMKSP